MTKRQPEKRPKKVGDTRVLTLRLGEGPSLENQAAAIRNYVLGIGADLLAIEEDIQIGGGHPFACEGLKAIIEQAVREQAAILVTRGARLKT